MEIITVWDTETTGKLDEKHRIIELSARVYNLANGSQIIERLWRFNPERNIDAKAFAVHGISIDELKDKPLIKEELPAILNLFKSSKFVVAHNGDDFDVPFLEMETKRNGLVFPKIKTFDTMVHGTFATDLGKSPSLQELCWCLDIDYDLSKAHRGDYDTNVLGQAFFEGLKRGWFKLEEKC